MTLADQHLFQVRKQALVRQDDSDSMLLTDVLAVMLSGELVTSVLVQL